MTDKANDSLTGGGPARHSETRGLEPDSASSRPSVEHIAAHPLEHLVDLSNAIEIDASATETTQKFVTSIASALPRCAVGACVVDPQSGASFVCVETPPGLERLPGRDPSRLFPEFTIERVVSLTGAQGSTLHVATDDAELLVDGSETLELVERTARMLSAALVRGRRFQDARESTEDLRRLQAKVIQAEKLASLGQIVAGLVHELNNPLTSIVAYSEYLKRKAQRRAEVDPDGEDDLERLRRIGEAAERILKFSRDLVAYARPSAEVPGPVALADVIDKALVFCEHEFARANVEVDRMMPPYVPPVRGIAGQLTQVFVNLFTNAAHAMGEQGGKVTIGVRVCSSGDALIVEVRDNGVGISAEAIPRIFDPFFTTKTDGRGTGLGLSIVKDIVTTHGGTLTASSTPGEGSAFSVVLPLVAMPPSMLPPPRLE
jgi:signal transduction histidine kinase